MMYRASRDGEWPMGLFWTAGEVREVEGDAPAWLVPAEVVAAPAPAGDPADSNGEEG